VTDDLADRGLVDFSLRRAAKAAGTTHKVLLYYFDGPEDLLAQAMIELRRRRIDEGAAAARHGSLADRVRALWPVLTSGYAWVHDQGIGLMMYDPSRYLQLGRGSSQQYLPALVAVCPEHWPSPE
jgi:AcrR family transcriptional regulator